ncbi:hypothetical protein CR513_19323, partial [Mucuna pruriens]
MHVINLNPAVALNIKVPDKIWSSKDVKYDHLRVFDCKAFVHVPKDERSKLDSVSSLCMVMMSMVIGCMILLKLVKSRDTTLEKNNSLSEIDLVRMPVHDLDTIDNNFQNDEQHNYVGDQQLGDGFDVPFDDDAEEEQEMLQDENLSYAPEPPPRQSSTRYTYDEYVTLIDGEELECYQESMKSDERQKA